MVAGGIKTGKSTVFLTRNDEFTTQSNKSGCESVSYLCDVGKCVEEKPVNPKCGLHVEYVGNRHDNRNC